MEESGVFELKGGTVLPDSNEILINGELVKLTPKEKEVLLLLHSHRGSTVSRSQLLQTVWGDALGNDSGLTQAISRLRKIFKDDPKQPKLIKTIPKTGYQLISDPNQLFYSKHRKSSILAGYMGWSKAEKRGLRFVLIALAFVIFLLIFRVRIRIEQLPAFLADQVHALVG